VANQVTILYHIRIYPKFAKRWDSQLGVFVQGLEARSNDEIYSFATLGFDSLQPTKTVLVGMSDEILVTAVAMAENTPETIFCLADIL